jgi:hypothetical protein
MMKRLTILKLMTPFLIVFSSNFYVNCQNNEGQKEKKLLYNSEYDFYGQVDSLVLKKYSITNNIKYLSKKDSNDSYVAIFNPLGYKTRQEKYFKRNSNITYNYDERWEITKELWFKGENLIMENNFEYDDRGNIIYLFDFLLGSPYSERYYRYDENNDRIEELIKMNDKIADDFIYEYDRDGLNRKVAIKKFQTYDIFTNTRVKNFIGQKLFEYQGDFLKYEVEYFSDGNPDYEKFYDESGKLVKETYYETEYTRVNIDISNTAKYPQNHTYSYVYDSLGNWTYKTLFINGVKYKEFSRNLYYRK